MNSTQFSALTLYYQVLLKSYKDKQKMYNVFWKPWNNFKDSLSGIWFLSFEQKISVLSQKHQSYFE